MRGDGSLALGSPCCKLAVREQQCCMKIMLVHCCCFHSGYMLQDVLRGSSLHGTGMYSCRRPLARTLLKKHSLPESLQDVKPTIVLCIEWVDEIFSSHDEHLDGSGLFISFSHGEQLLHFWLCSSTEFKPLHCLSHHDVYRLCLPTELGNKKSLRLVKVFLRPSSLGSQPRRHDSGRFTSKQHLGAGRDGLDFTKGLNCLWSDSRAGVPQARSLKV